MHEKVNSCFSDSSCEKSHVLPLAGDANKIARNKDGEVSGMTMTFC